MRKLVHRRNLGFKGGSHLNFRLPNSMKGPAESSGEKRRLHMVGALLRRTKPGGECSYDA